MPMFDEAFTAFGRGALVATDCGPVAVEDLVPGMRIETADQGPETLLWVGSTTLFATAAEQRGDALQLTRIATEAFGPSRPSHDLILGPFARLLHRNARCLDRLGVPGAFVPAECFRDGLSVIGVTPIAPVRVFHLGFRGQQTVLANGLEIESYHPGPHFDTRMDRGSLEAFLGFFPHAATSRGFGPMKTPRLTRHEFETLGDT